MEHTDRLVTSDGESMNEHMEPLSSNSGPTFSKLLRTVLGRLLILGKSWENIWQSTNLELGNNDAIIIVINTFIFTSCWMLST